MTHITLCILFTAHCAQCTSYRLWKVQRRTLPWGQMSVYCTTCIKYTLFKFTVSNIHRTLYGPYSVHRTHATYTVERFLGDRCLYIVQRVLNTHATYSVQRRTQSASSGTDVCIYTIYCTTCITYTYRLYKAQRRALPRGQMSVYIQYIVQRV